MRTAPIPTFDPPRGDPPANESVHPSVARRETMAGPLDAVA